MTRESRMESGGGMKKVLAINGGPRKNGATGKLLQRAVQTLSRRFEVEYMHAYDLSIRPCMGCFRCRPDSACLLDRDDGHRIGEKITAADILVVGTPVYWGNIPAPLKLVFDRNVTTFEHFLHGAPEPKLKGKRAVIILTCGSSPEDQVKPDESRGALQAIRKVFDNGGVETIGEVVMASSWDYDNMRQDAEHQLDEIIRRLD
jgi:multimeric flavodoxin WrbA